MRLLHVPTDIKMFDITDSVAASTTSARAALRLWLSIALVIWFSSGVLAQTVEGQVFWFGDYARINRAELDGSSIRTIVFPSPKAEALAFDRLENKVYWSENLNGPYGSGDDEYAIRRMVVGSNQHEDVIHGTDVRAMAVDELARKLYWVEADATPSIKRSNLDGTNIETLVDTGLVEPVSLELDLEHGRFYWSDLELEQIRRAELTGEAIEVVVQDSGLVDLSIDGMNGRLYWSRAGSIVRSDLDGGGRTLIVETPIDSLWGDGDDYCYSGIFVRVEVVPERGELFWSSPGVYGGGICRTGLDGQNVVDFTSTGYIETFNEGSGDPLRSDLIALPTSDLLIFSAQDGFKQYALEFYMHGCELSGGINDGGFGPDRCPDGIPGWPTWVDPYPRGGMVVDLASDWIVDDASDWIYTTGSFDYGVASQGSLIRIRTDGSESESTCVNWTFGGQQDLAFDRRAGKFYVANPALNSSQGCPGFGVEMFDSHSIALDTTASRLYSIRRRQDDGLLWLAASELDAPYRAEWLAKLRDQEVNCWSEPCPDDLGYRYRQLYWRDGNLIKATDTSLSTTYVVVNHTAPIDAFYLGKWALYWVSQGTLFRMFIDIGEIETLWPIGEASDLYVVETAIYFYGKPELLSPPDGSTDLVLTPVLQWTNAGPDHGVRIYDESGTVFLRDELFSPELEVPSGYLKPNTTYYWEAWAHGIRGSGPVSDPFSFTTGGYAPPILTSPSNGGGPFETSLSLIWEATVDAERYNVHVAIDPDFHDVVYRENVPAPRANFVAPVAEQTYYWRAQATASGVSSPWSEIWSFSVGSTGPLAPELLTPPDGATNQTKTLDFSWDGAPDASSFHFQLSTTGDFSQVVRDVDGLDAKTYRLSGLNGATSYFWRVAGVDGAGRHTFSQPRSFTTVINAPKVIALLLPEDGAVHVPKTPEFSWTAQSTATTYQLQVATDMGFSNLIVNDSALTETSRTLTTPFSFGTTYFWRVRGRNAGGNGDWSEVRSFTTIVAAPDAVALIEPADGAKGVVLSPVFSWVGSESALYFQLQIATDSLMEEVIVNDSALTDPHDSLKVSLENSQEYFWHVRARNAGGDGPWSDIWSFRTEVATPEAVTLGSPDDGATGIPAYATLSWQAVDDVVGYHLQLDTDPAFATLVVNDSVLAQTSWTAVDPLAYGTTYYWHVRAGRDDGLGKTAGLLYGPWSDTRSFTIAVGTATEDESGIPDEFALHPAFPNPFNSTTTIGYDVPEAGFVRLTVFDVLGRPVKLLASGQRWAGRHRVIWSADGVPSGAYFLQMEADRFSSTQRLLLTR